MILILIIFCPLAMLLILSIFVAITIFWAIYRLLAYLLVKATAHIYGLPTLPLIGHIHLFPKCRFDLADFLIGHSNDALRKGHNLMIWWFGPEINIWTLNGESSRVILENSMELTKGHDYAFFTPWLGEGLLLSDGVKWKSQRRLLTPTFHFTKLEQYTHIFNSHGRKLAQKLAKLGEEEPVDIGSMLTRCSLDIVAEAIMGVQLDPEQSDCLEYVQAVEDFNRYSHDFVMSPLYNFVPLAWHLFGHGRATRKCVRTLRQFTRKVIEERIKIRKITSTMADEPKKGKAFLDLLLELQETEGMEPEEVQNQVDTFMFAGHDTTAHALMWTLWCLACHSECQQRVHAELVDQFGTIFDIENCDVDEQILEFDAASINELRYMDRCVREALRIFPPVPAVERELQNDVHIDGKRIPKGTLVVVPPMLLHHNEQIYPNHWDYDPDNFLPERTSGRGSFDYIPFSAGPRNCIGQKFGMMELKIVLAHILARFQFSTNLTFRQNRPALEPILRLELGVPLFVKTRRKIPISVHDL